MEDFRGDWQMAEKTGLISLEEAIGLSRAEVRALHQEYLNAGLVTLLKLVDFDKRFVRAAGVRLWDNEGREYLDFLGGYGSLNTGHNHPRIIAAVESVREMPNLLQASLSPLAGALAKNLSAVAPGDLRRSFFCNSGAEAVEGAIKLARIATGRSKLIYTENSFHGKTFGALSVTGRLKYQEAFRPLVSECQIVPYDNLAELEQALCSKEAAAFIVEPIQGEGGINVPSPGYLKEAKRICAKYGTLFVVDEIQTGLGRTGKMFACEHEGVEPDILCLAKSLGGGVMPIGAYLATDSAWRRAYGSLDRALLHTSTFGGNAWACAAALATLEVVVGEDLPRQAAEKGEYLLRRLGEIQAISPLLKEVRGRGLLIGLEFAERKGLAYKLSFGLLEKLSEEYLGSLVAGELLNKYRLVTAYTLNNPSVLRLEPPLTVSREQLDYLLGALSEILERNRNFLKMAASGFKTVLDGRRKA
ncbi:MAG TPA: aspartate aminotransferase family protein [Desulfotomaculum sp.]|nr:aspartate aminotransferase family protein [Desulfotomaculum sp.]